MATVKNTVQVALAEVKVVNLALEASGTIKPLSTATDQITILQYEDSFASLIGSAPTQSLLMSTTETTKNPFFHEACVYIPTHEELYVTSNLLEATKSSSFPTILISRLKFHRTAEKDIQTVEWVKMRPPAGIDMPNGGVNYVEDSIIFCAQGSATTGSGGIYHMPRGSAAKPLVTNFHGRDFNSPNDVVVAKDGAIWFTDPCYANEADFRQRPKLPNQVYRFEPQTGDLRVVADGFGRPNGIAFSPDEKTCYITDTDQIHGDGKDLRRAATIYAFDVAYYSDSPFLVNRRLFAYAANGFPDGIKCDAHGNVYSGCGDGVEVWNTAGRLIGKIAVPGGVSNFCFGRNGEMFLCAQTRIWRVQLAPSTKGALLGI